MDSSSDSEDDVQKQKFLEAADTTLFTNLFKSKEVSELKKTANPEFAITAPTSAQNMDSSSDSEDDAQRQKFLEAADPTLFTNLFKNKKRGEVEKAAFTAPKSARHLLDTDDDTNVDNVNIAETQKSHLYKKLSLLIAQNIEFENVNQTAANTLKPPKKTKSKVKLLRDADCYVKPYNEFEFESAGPLKKPIIKRRQTDLDLELPSLNMAEQLKAAAVDGHVIIAGLELKNWAQKPVRANKVFRYKSNKNGTTLHECEVENEFTKLRRKNNWSVRKIQDAYKSKQRA